MTFSIKLAQTFSEQLSKGISQLFGVLFGIFFTLLFSAWITIILFVFIALRKFVFKRSKIYWWTARIIGLIFSIISISLIAKIILLPANAAGLAIFPVIPALIGIYCVFKLK